MQNQSTRITLRRCIKSVNPALFLASNRSALFVLLFELGCVEKHQTDRSSTSDQEGWQTSCGDSVLPSWKLRLENGFHEECSACSGGDSTSSPCGWTQSDVLLPCLQIAYEFCGHGSELLLLI